MTTAEIALHEADEVGPLAEAAGVGLFRQQLILRRGQLYVQGRTGFFLGGKRCPAV